MARVVDRGIHRELVELDFTLSRFNHWLEKWRTSQRKADATAAGAADMTEALERVNQERARVAAEMRRHDLLNPFSAAFFAGTAIFFLVIPVKEALDTDGRAVADGDRRGCT